MTDTVYKELQKKYDRLKTIVKVFRNELRSLRKYKAVNEKLNRDYVLAKRRKRSETLDLFSYKTRVDTLFRIRHRLERVRNNRIERYDTERNKATRAKAPELRSRFVGDMSVLTEELRLVTSHVRRTIKKRRQLPRETFNEFVTAPLREVDSSKFRRCLELYVSSDGGSKWRLLHRAFVTPSFRPAELPVHGPGPLTGFESAITHVKVVHARYNYPRLHPNPYLAVRRSRTFEIHARAEEPIPQRELWAEYRNRYGDASVMTVLREINLTELRDIVHRVYCELAQARLRLPTPADGSAAKSPRLCDALYAVIDKNYVVQEVVHKVLYEVLTALEKYEKKHYDILEFVNGVEGGDTACGRCISLLLMLVKHLWLVGTHDYGVPMDSKRVEVLVRSLYPTLDEDTLNTICRNALHSDEECLAKNEYPITKINKFFILAFRDLTEHWCSTAELEIGSMFESEEVTLERFCLYMYRNYPLADDSLVRKRFRESFAIKRRIYASRHVVGLSPHDLAYVAGELRWADMHARIVARNAIGSGTEDFMLDDEKQRIDAIIRADLEAFEATSADGDLGELVLPRDSPALSSNAAHLLHMRHRNKTDAELKSGAVGFASLAALAALAPRKASIWSPGNSGAATPVPQLEMQDPGLIQRKPQKTKYARRASYFFDRDAAAGASAKAASPDEGP